MDKRFELSRLAISLVVAILPWAGTATSAVLDGMELRDRERPISIVAEEGVIVPPLTLLELEKPGIVRAEITSGPAFFLIESSTRSTKVFSSMDRTVTLPKLMVGNRRGYDSEISITVDGEPIGDPLRVGVTLTGYLDKFDEIPHAMIMVLFIDFEARYAILDEEQMVYLMPSGGTGLREDGAEWCPENVWLAPLVEDDFPSTQLCLASLSGGTATWQMSNPGATGARFSVKPESVDNALNWARAPSDFPVDGVYRFTWGCGIALKVPNGCQLTSRVTTGKCCCNPLSLASGNFCSWINPYQHGDWPNCPLGSPPALSIPR